MKKILIMSYALCALVRLSAQENNSLLQQLTTCVEEKCSFVKKHDKLNVLPRIITICVQLQEICKESQTIRQERRFALDRELAILVHLYFKQLPEEEVAELKNIIKKYHTLQREIIADPAAQKAYSQRQKHYIELILV